MKIYNYQLPPQVFCTEDPFDLDRIELHQRRQCFFKEHGLRDLHFGKPDSWLWTSSLNEGRNPEAFSDWVAWCHDEDFGWDRRRRMSVIEFSPITTWLIKGEASLDALFEGHDKTCCWTHAAEAKDIDAIHLTLEGHRATRLRWSSSSLMDQPSTNSWDCESVAWVKDPRPFILSHRQVPDVAHSRGMRVAAIESSQT